MNLKPLVLALLLAPLGTACGGQADSDSTKARALAEVARQYIAVGQSDRGSALFSQALQLTEHIGDACRQTSTLAQITGQVAASGQQPQASQLLARLLQRAKQTTAGECPNPVDPYQLVNQYAEQGQYFLAQQAIDAVDQPSSRTHALAALARQAAIAGRAELAAASLSRAWQLAQTLSEASQGELYAKASIYAQIADQSARLGQIDPAAAILSQTLTLAQRLDDREKKFQGLAQGMDFPVTPRRVDPALLWVEALQRDSVLRFSRLSRASYPATQSEPVVEAAGVFLDLLRTPPKFRHAYFRDNELTEAALLYAGLGRHSQALRIAHHIGDSFLKTNTLTEIASSYRQTGQIAPATTLLAQALQLTPSIEGDFFRAEALAQIAAQYAKLQQPAKAKPIFAQARQIAQSLAYAYARDGAFAALADQLLEAGQLDSARQTVQAIQDPNLRSVSLSAIARQYAAAGQAELALQLAQTIPEAPYQVSTLTDIAHHTAQQGHTAQAVQILTQALQTAEAIR